MIASLNNWQFIMAFGLCLVAIGHFMDLMFKKHEIRELHNKLLRWSIKIEESPLRYWQLKVALYGARILKYPPTISEMLAFHPKNESVKIRGFQIFFGISFLIIIGAAAHEIFLSGSIPWVIKSYSTSIVLFVLMIAIFFYLKSISKYRRRFQYAYYRFNPIFFVPTILFSLTGSIIAILITGYTIPTIDCENYWFSVTNAENIYLPKAPFLLPLINFPFDYLTLTITGTLLLKICKKRNHIILYALLDVAASLILAMFLYITLKFIAIESLSFQGIKDILLDCYILLSELLKILLSDTSSLRNLKDVQLVPLLLTTFIPVSLYMLSVTSLSLGKPLMWTISRLFSAVGEREESVFKQFATFIAASVAALKAAVDLFTA